VVISVIKCIIRGEIGRAIINVVKLVIAIMGTGISLLLYYISIIGAIIFPTTPVLSTIVI
jgi:hypothetical protein